MNPGQLRETTMSPDTRRLVRLTLADDGAAEQLLNMLLARNRAQDRLSWLQDKADLARP